MIDQKSHWVKDYTYYDPFSSSHCHWGRNQAGFNLSLSGRVFLTDNRVVKPSDFIYDPATGRYRERETFLSQETADYPNHRDLIDGYGKDLTVYGGIYSWDKGKTGFYLYPNTVEVLNDDMKRGLASLIGVHKITERTPVYENSSNNLLFRLGDIASRTPYRNPTRSAGQNAYGFMVGAGYEGATKELDNMVVKVAEALEKAFKQPVEIRFNSDRKSGGAWLKNSQPGLSGNHEVGIGVGYRGGDIKKALYLYVMAERNVLKSYSDANQGNEGSRYAYYEQPDIAAAVKWLKSHVEISQVNMPEHQALDIKFDKNVWGKWQTISDFQFPDGGYSTAFVRQHKNVELRHGYPFSKVSLVQVSGKGKIFVITAQTSSHSVFPLSPSSRYGETAPVKGQTGIRLFHVEETAPNLKVALMKAEALKKTMVQRFEKVTRDTMPVKNPEELTMRRNPEDIGELQARINAMIEQRTRYGLRKEITSDEGYDLSWSNSGYWYVDYTGKHFYPKGVELNLDANEIFVPNTYHTDMKQFHKDLFFLTQTDIPDDKKKRYLKPLPLWGGSFERMGSPEYSGIEIPPIVKQIRDRGLPLTKEVSEALERKAKENNPGKGEGEIPKAFADAFSEVGGIETGVDRFAFIAVETQRVPSGQYAICLIIENKSGYRITDRVFPTTDFKEATKIAGDLNWSVLKLTPSVVSNILMSTMRNKNPFPHGMAHLGDETAAAEAMNPKFVVAPYRQGVDGFVWYIPKKTTLYVTPDTLKESPITISHEYGHWANRRFKKSFRGLNLKLDYNSEMQLRIFWDELGAWEWALNRAPAKSVDQVRVRHCLMTYIPDQFGDYEIRHRMYKLIEDFLNRYESKFTRNTYKRKNPIENDGLMLNLADHAMALFAGDLEGTVAWLVKIGAKDVIWETDTDGRKISASLTGPSGMRVGIIPTDPVNCSIILGMAIANMYWPQAFPGLLKEVNRRWKETQYSRAGKK